MDGSVHSLFPVAITAAGREALREWVEGEKASRTIEIGLGYGIGGAVRMRSLLASAEANARHVVIDPHQATRFADCGLQFLEEAAVIEIGRVPRRGSETVLPRFLAEGRSVQLAFVDGNHRLDGVFLDLIYLGRLVRRGGIIFVDDCQLPSVSRAVSSARSASDGASRRCRP